MHLLRMPLCTTAATARYECSYLFSEYNIATFLWQSHLAHTHHNIRVSDALPDCSIPPGPGAQRQCADRVRGVPEQKVPNVLRFCDCMAETPRRSANLFNKDTKSIESSRQPTAK